MVNRIRKVVVLAIAAAAAVVAATVAPGASAVTGALRIVGPYGGAEQRAFEAVLSSFERTNPGLEITYAAAPGGVSHALASARSAGRGVDVAIMRLPTDGAAMTSMARSGALKPLDFAAPIVDANYAFSFKRLGSVDGKLFGVFVKATNRSAFWYERKAFEAAGTSPPRSFEELKRIAAGLDARGTKPFAIGSLSGVVLPALFQNTYLALHGNRQYDRLANGQLAWSDGSVRDSLRAMREALANPARLAGGLASLQADLPMAAQQVFGTPSKAAMMIGGSSLLPVLNAAKAVRPLSEFGVFPFPRLSPTGPPRVIGDADAAVMVRDTQASRALVRYLGSPEAAAAWAASDPYYVSPNRRVDPAAYRSDAVRTLATALTGAPTFRFSAVEMQRAPGFAGTFNRLVREFVRSPGALDRVVAELDRAAKGSL